MGPRRPPPPRAPSTADAEPDAALDRAAGRRLRAWLSRLRSPSHCLAGPRWGGIVPSANGVWRILRRYGLNHRNQRHALVAGQAIPPGPERPPPEPERHLEAEQPGDLVQFDCFTVGRLSGTKGRAWQYTAIDVASGYTWADLHATPHNPDARFTRALLRRVHRELAAAGWHLQRVTTDNGSEFRSRTFRETADIVFAANKMRAKA